MKFTCEIYLSKDHNPLGPFPTGKRPEGSPTVFLGKLLDASRQGRAWLIKQDLVDKLIANIFGEKLSASVKTVERIHKLSKAVSGRTGW